MQKIDPAHRPVSLRPAERHLHHMTELQICIVTHAKPVAEGGESALVTVTTVSNGYLISKHIYPVNKHTYSHTFS